MKKSEKKFNFKRQNPLPKTLEEERVRTFVTYYYKTPDKHTGKRWRTVCKKRKLGARRAAMIRKAFEMNGRELVDFCTEYKYNLAEILDLRNRYYHMPTIPEVEKEKDTRQNIFDEYWKSLAESYEEVGLGDEHKPMTQRFMVGGDRKTEWNECDAKLPLSYE